MDHGVFMLCNNVYDEFFNANLVLELALLMQQLGFPLFLSSDKSKTLWRINAETILTSTGFCLDRLDLSGLGDISHQYSGAGVALGSESEIYFLTYDSLCN